MNSNGYLSSISRPEFKNEALFPKAPISHDKGIRKRVTWSHRRNNLLALRGRGTYKSFMRTIIFLVVLFGLFPTAQGAAPALILVTAFEPFGGSKDNGSQIIAARLKQSEREFLKRGFRLVTCVLPVEYDRGATAAQACYRALGEKPFVVVSLGEAACDVRLESRFHNLDHTPRFADNAGVIRENHVIDPRAPAEVPTALPLPSMFCAKSPVDPVDARPSQSPGNYVCNGTAFRLQRFFAKENIPYGFIHVPNSGCRDGRAEAAAPMVGRMILAGAEAIREPRELDRVTMVSRAEVESVLATLKNVPDRSCRKQFFTGLLSAYPAPIRP